MLNSRTVFGITRIWRWKWVIGFILMTACVERIDFDTPAARSIVVIEGLISDEPGPYMIQVTRALPLDADTSLRVPVLGAEVTLHDDAGLEERMVAFTPGYYQSGGVIRGQVGHRYYVTVKVGEVTFQSAPDELTPVGEIQTIRTKFERRYSKQQFGDVLADVFNVFIDADAGEGNRYVRWKFTGTYKAMTNPELRALKIAEFVLKAPLPCSGYTVEPGGGGGVLTKMKECTCCTCWARHYEDMPHLSDDEKVSDGKYLNIKVGEVPINGATFFEKYLIEVDQMSLTRTSYEFFNQIRAQRQSATNIFQPAYGAIIGNITSSSPNQQAIGLFYSTAIRRKFLYLTPEDVPYGVPPIFFVTDSCTSYYRNSTSIQPSTWK